MSRQQQEFPFGPVSATRARGIVAGRAKVPEPDPAPQTETEFTPEPEPKRPSPHSASLYHPLDPVLAQHDQDKLTAFLLKQGFITEVQNYKWCGPNATSRILKQLPSFLKAAGLDAVSA